ncbi:DNA-processing protein DprA [Marinobacter sp. LV10R510-11A]|uniref:DNA-processing protein DprA n=1 Tax=Marinobacter sp. LV10R510-11A TaxID=1415568 RepID=UPI000BB7C817|nr:DNA-processing protein DprA [Marinobacter sp. LV10R510-11A]
MFSSRSAQWLFLTCLPKFGRTWRRAMLATIPDLTDLLTRNPATLKALGLHGETVAGILAWQQQDEANTVVKAVRQILLDCEQHAIELVSWQHPHYPEVLRHIHDAPLVLYVRGDSSLLSREQIGIIGSRNATPAGLDHARRFAAELSKRGLLITSGLALGVDGAAHAGALDAGHATVAVVGCGLDRVYPNQHRRLCERVIGNGLVISEYPPGTPARAAHFPQRNRIISGLSRGILVVEAGLKSGSLITARLALEQGREVFAIPGSIHSPVARGCHDLIKQGARLVDQVDDILEELGAAWSLSARSALPVLGATNATEEAPAASVLGALDCREIAVFEALGYDPQSTDALCSATGLPANQLVQSLLLLELDGLVSAAPGGFQKIA